MASTINPEKKNISQNRPGESARKSVEIKLQETIQTLFELGIMVNDYHSESGFHAKLNQLISHYQDLDDLKEGLHANIPLEAIDYVESGRNPDEFTAAFLERAVGENQFTYGKVQAVSDFRDQLAEKIGEAFPELAPALVQESVERNQKESILPTRSGENGSNNHNIHGNGINGILYNSLPSLTSYSSEDESSGGERSSPMNASPDT